MAEEYTVSHTGSVLGEEYVELERNQTDPKRRDTVVSFECPDKFEGLHYRAPEHPVRFEPRTVEEHEADGDEIELEGEIQPIAGEADLEDQPYPVVEVVNTETGNKLSVESVDYVNNTVELESAPSDGTDLKAYPILTNGTIKWGGRNALNQDQGTLYPWGFPVFRFHDMDQIRAGREVTLDGEAEWGHNEKLELRLKSDQPIVWEDEDYPGAFVSSIEVDLRIFL